MIQGLRGVAVLLVILFHFDLGIANGFLGVDIFFVVSGFVISRLIHNRLKNGSFTFKEFYFSRFNRLFPTLAFVVLATLIFSAIFTNPTAFQTTWQTGLSALFGLSNLTAQIVSTDYFAPDSAANALLHTWSLGIEEQFYLFLPLVLFAIYRTVKSFVHTTATFISVASLTSLALFISSDNWEQIPVLGALLGYYSPITRAWEFGVGILVYFLTDQKIKYFRRISAIFPALGTILVSLASLGDFQILSIPIWVNYVLAVFGAALILFAGVTSARATPLLSSPTLRWLGDRSYSLYLWHWPLAAISSFYFDLGINPLTLILILTLGTISHFSYMYLERDFRIFLVTKSGKFFPLGILMAATSFVAIAAVLPGSISPETTRQHEQRLERPIIYDYLCHDQNKVCSSSGQVMDFSKGGQNVYLVGDSNAAHHFPGLVLASKTVGMNLYSLTASGCKGLDLDMRLLQIRGENARIPKCQNFENWVMETLSSAPAGVVILGFSLEYVENPFFDDQVSLVELVWTLNDFQKFTQEAGHRLIIVEPIPFWNGQYYEYNPDLIASISSNGTIKAPNKTWKESFGEIDTWPGLQLSRDTLIFETHEILCEAESCPLIKDGKFLYRDSTHISVYASENMSLQWAKILEAVRVPVR